MCVHDLTFCPRRRLAVVTGDEDIRKDIAQLFAVEHWNTHAHRLHRAGHHRPVIPHRTCKLGDTASKLRFTEIRTGSALSEDGVAPRAAFFGKEAAPAIGVAGR